MTRPLLLILCLLAAGLRRRRARARPREERHASPSRSRTSATNPQTIRARPGRLRVDARPTAGRLAHTFRVERKDAIVAKISSLLPGDRDSTTFKVRKGEYRFFCALSNHEELGMYGTLIVK